MSISSGESVADSVMVPLESIPTDPGGQTRAKLRAAVVRQYAAAMREQIAAGGVRFPPVVLFSDGKDCWLADGFHRVLAARMAGLSEIAADVRVGTKRDAILYGVGANTTHGLPRSNPDKRKAVALLLADAECSQWNNREIARRCRVAPSVVDRLRPSLSASERQMAKRKVQRGGAVYEMDVKVRSAAASDTATTDAVGIPVPEHLAKMFAALDDFQEAQDQFDRLAGLLDRIAQGPAGELYRQELVKTAASEQPGFACPALRVSLQRLLAAQPYCCCCPNCQKARGGRALPTCPVCRGRGWTTRPAFERCQLSDRQRILQGDKGTS